MKVINNRTAKQITDKLLKNSNSIHLIEIEGYDCFVEILGENLEKGLYKVSEKFKYDDYLYNRFGYGCYYKNGEFRGVTHTIYKN